MIYFGNDVDISDMNQAKWCYCADWEVRPESPGLNENRAWCVSLFADINRAIELLDKLQRTGEVPPQKLQALQRVLQSEFCNAVREVSQNVHFENTHACGGDVIVYCETMCFRFMSMYMKPWTSTAAPRSEPMRQLR